MCVCVCMCVLKLLCVFFMCIHMCECGLSEYMCVCMRALACTHAYGCVLCVNICV